MYKVRMVCRPPTGSPDAANPHRSVAGTLDLQMRILSVKKRPCLEQTSLRSLDHSTCASFILYCSVWVRGSR